MSEAREGYLWDVMQGRKAPPPAAVLLDLDGSGCPRALKGY